MKLRCWLMFLFLIASCGLAEAQQPAKISRLGFLTGGSHSGNPARNEAFRQALRELGYVEGKNIVIEWRASEGKRDRLRPLAAELARLKVDVILVHRFRETTRREGGHCHNSHCHGCG